MTWDFEPVTAGWERQVPLRDRVTLYYVLANRDITDTYLTNNGDGKRRRAMARAVADFYGDEPFIWSTNAKHRETATMPRSPAPSSTSLENPATPN